MTVVFSLNRRGGLVVGTMSLIRKGALPLLVMVDGVIGGIAAVDGSARLGWKFLEGRLKIEAQQREDDTGSCR